MKIKLHVRSTALALGLLAVAIPARIEAQIPGGIEFTAQVAPTDGRPEPVRQLTFCLLSKSLDDVRQEAMQLEPAPDLDAFIDGLTLSPELKAWMRRNRMVRLVGMDFTKSLTADDIVDVPEFFDAYMQRNEGFEGTGFPKPKFNKKDRASKQEKYDQEKKDYKEAVRAFIKSVPVSAQGIEAELTKIDPSFKWDQLVGSHRQRLDNRTLELAQTRYLVAQTDTNLDGRGRFGGLAPGNYWIGMLGMQAVSGDVRLRWDFPVTVRPGETAHVELTNLNAAKPYSAAENSNR
jgi:hypothetical protein